MPAPTVAPCPDADTLERFLLGELAGPAADTLEIHLTTCPACDARLAGVPAEDALLAVVGRRSAVLDAVPTEQVERVLAHLLSGPVPGSETDDAHDFLDAPETPDEIGRIGPYRVLRQIGRGGMGVVFEAEDTRLPRVVALKLVRDGRLGDPHYRARFRQEADALARLQHPNIIPVYEAGEHRGRPYLALEFAAGGSLAEYLQGRPQPPPAAASLIATVADAVQYAHERGVLHRDLKPGNILLQKDDGGRMKDESVSSFILHPSSFRPKVADFGLARHLDEAGLTQTGDLLGTPAYMAPELTRGENRESKDSPVVDVYSLGAILYECLTGRAPFGGETVPDTFEQVRSLDPVPPRRMQPKVPRDLEIICLNCLQKDPRKRYATAGNLADDLRRFVAGQPIRARPAGPIERLTKWSRRKPAWATVVAVSLVSGVALSIVAVRYERQLRRAVATAEQNAEDARREREHARANNRTAERNAEDARREREHARANYREAKAALEKMLGRSANRRYGDLPLVRELRKEQQEDALAFYLVIAGQTDDPDPEIRWDAAQARFEASGLQIQLGRFNDARENLRQAIGSLTKLAAAHPEESKYRRSLVNALTRLGLITPGADGRRLLEQALPEVEALLASKPDAEEYRNDLAQLCHVLGQHAFGNGDVDAAARYTQRGVEVRRKLLAAHPDWRDQQVALAQSLANLFLFRREKTPIGELEPLVREATDLLDQAIKSDPADPVAMTTLAALRINWAPIDISRGKAAEAEADVGRVIEGLETFLAKEPNWADARDRLYAAYGTRALARDTQGRPGLAAVDQRRVVELAPTPEKRKIHRIELVLLLIDAGALSAAATSLEDTAADPAPVPSESRFVKLLEACARLNSVGRWGVRPYRDRAHKAAKSIIEQTRKAISADEWEKWLRSAQKNDSVSRLLSHSDIQPCLR
jgi:serine/threonine protein kinase